MPEYVGVSAYVKQMIQHVHKHDLQILASIWQYSGDIWQWVCDL